MRTLPAASFGLAQRRALVTGHRGGIGGAVAALSVAEGAGMAGLAQLTCSTALDWSGQYIRLNRRAPGALPRGGKWPTPRRS